MIPIHPMCNKKLSDMTRINILVICILCLLCTSTYGQCGEFRKELCSAFLKGSQNFVDSVTGRHYTIIKKSEASFIVKDFSNNIGLYQSEADYIVVDSSKCNCEIHGVIRDYYRTGESLAYINYKNDFPHGFKIQYYKSGQIAQISNYQHGVVEGSHIEYYKNGKVGSSGQFANGYKSGEWRYYDSLGNLKAIGEYTGGVVLFESSSNLDTLFFENTITKERGFAIGENIDVMLDSIGTIHGYSNYSQPMYMGEFFLYLKKGIWIEIENMVVVKKTWFDNNGRFLKKEDY